MTIENINGVPKFECFEFAMKLNDYAIIIPIINEGDRIHHELKRAKDNSVSQFADIIICDGGSSDGCTNIDILKSLDVNTLLIKKDLGKQGAQLRMGFWWAIQRGYKGVITIDGNNKDSIEDVPRFIEKLKEGYDFVQGSRFIENGLGINTPIIRKLAVKLIHAPLISFTSKHHYTDTTNAFRGYSIKYLTDKRVQPLRDIFMTYELLAYLSVRATQIGMKACEVPVTRAYPSIGKIPTKISLVRGNTELLLILIKNLFGCYSPN
ncbi:MAG: glycosyltransferase family 2 protein [Bacteroidales bacterium]|nr:glycosyltransferase family 2 protein [Bacteroidales bacterium]